MLTLRLKLQEGFDGAVISLLDRIFNPTDVRGDDESIFMLPFHLTAASHSGTRSASANGTPTLYLKTNYREPLGINYVRIRSTAKGIDAAGLLLESVSADADDTPE